jgi:hypothetical protein
MDNHPDQAIDVKAGYCLLISQLDYQTSKTKVSALETRGIRKTARLRQTLGDGTFSVFT